MKIIYATRVLFIGWEFVLLLMSFSLFFHSLGIEFFEIFKIPKIDDITKWIAAVPFCVLVWNLNEARLTLNFSGAQVKLILNWKSYWKFKIHIFISVFYSLIFLVMAVVPWLYFGGAEDPRSVYFLITGLIGETIVAASLYFAKLKMFEIVNMYG